MGKASVSMLSLALLALMVLADRAVAIELFECEGRLSKTTVTGGSLAKNRIKENGFLIDFNDWPLGADIKTETRESSAFIGFDDKKITVGLAGGYRTDELLHTDCNAKDSFIFCKKQFDFLAKSSIPTVSEVLLAYRSPLGFEFTDRSVVFEAPIGSDEFFVKGRVNLRAKVESTFLSTSCRKVPDLLPSPESLGF
jgi:hypothetical protein